MKLETRVTKLEQQTPECDIAARILAARKPGYKRTSTAELEKLAKKHGGLWQRILHARRRAEPPMTPERIAKLKQIVAENPKYQGLLDQARQRANDSDIADKRTRTRQAVSTKLAGKNARPKPARRARRNRRSI